jgi:glycosyltransferase involved in cell wall biosynthesis
MSAVLAQASHGEARLRVVMAGPLPPGTGGMTTVIDDLSRSRLAQDVDLLLFDTKKSTPEGRSALQAVAARLRLWRDWWLALRGPRTVAHVHTCSGLSFFLDGALVATARLQGVPVVLHIHGGRFDRFLDELHAPLAAVARWIARRASRVVVLSEEWRDRLASRLPGARVAIVRNGVIVAAADATVTSRDASRVVVLFLGALTRKKGVFELVEALPGLPSSVHCLLVGPEKDAGIREALREKAVALGVEDRITLPGPVTGPAKAAVLAQADVFVLPSHIEGLPVSMLEAMAAGLPVVVTPVGAVPSIVRSGENGLVVPVGDVARLRAALAALAENEDLRAKLGGAGRALVEVNYSVDRAAGELLHIYDEVAAS